MRSPIYMAKLQSIKAGLCRPAEKGRIKGMTSYRRLISYIYAYEGKTKGKNIGFAKLESRNGQCKLSVNVKKVYVGGSAVPGKGDMSRNYIYPGRDRRIPNICVN